MTIVRDMPSQLILAHAPWLLGAGLIVCITACAGAGVTLIFAGETAGLWTVLLGGGIPLAIFAACVKRNQAIFDAITGTVTLQRRTLWRYDSRVVPLAEVIEAMREEIKEMSRPVLVLQQERIPLVQAHEGGNGPQRAVDVINAWLAQVDSARRPV
ncbi:MAG: hypothetical protein AAF218_07905 [Pseudomonadota bacterium]